MSDLSARGPRLRWIAAGYLALTIVFTWPLALGMASDVPGDLGDSLLNMWILGWGADQIPKLLAGDTTWAAYWNGNIFHPEPYSLALSEHLFGQALQAAPILAAAGNLILTEMLGRLSPVIAWVYARRITQRSRLSWREHHAIVEAIAR